MKNSNQISFTNSTNSNLYPSKYVCKYTNIELISTSDMGYQEYCASYISLKKSRRPDNYIPQQTTVSQKASNIIEFVIRECIGSEANRILKYSVFYKGEYQHHYRELDFVRFKKDGTILVGEIKTSNKGSAFLALPQLKLASEILSSVYKTVQVVSVFVNMSNNNSRTKLNESILSDSLETKISPDGFSFNVINVSPAEVLDYSNINELKIDQSIIKEACIEAIISANRRSENRIKKLAEQSTPTTVFGAMVQNALLQNSHYNQEWIAIRA